MFGKRRKIDGDKPEAREAHFRWRSCRIKKRYETKPDKPGMVAYACGYCGGWHTATDKRKT